MSSEERPRKKRSFNFSKRSQKQPEGVHEREIEQEIKSTHSANDPVPSTSRDFSSKNNENVPTSVRPGRTAKTTCLNRLAVLMSDIHDSNTRDIEDHKGKRRNEEPAEERQRRLDQMRERAAQKRADETDDRRQQRLAQKRERSAQKRADETDDRRQQRLDEERERSAQKRADETDDRRQQRLEEERERSAQKRADETDDRRQQRLAQKRERSAKKRADETDDRRQQRLEEERRRIARRRQALLVNRLSTYKAATNANTPCHSLQPFNVACIHCGALHFPEERVNNQIHRNSFGDCCLHGRIDVAHPEFPNELVRLFLRRHPLSRQFHTRIRNLNACFAMASFTVDDDRTINDRGVYSYVASGQVYHKLNLAAHPTQNLDGEFERPQYGQIYFLDNEDAVTERMNNPLNHGISEDLIILLENILRSENPFVGGFMMMREVEEEANALSAAEGNEAPYVKLLFALPDAVDHRRFNIPLQNEVCAIVTLNADQSFPDNELVIRQRGKSLIIMKNIDNRVEPFTYPLFYPKGTFGFSINMPLRTPYSSRQFLTRRELARYRIAFRPQLAKDVSSNITLQNPDLRLLNFNALHFGGRLFQQYLVDTFIRVEHDRIQWIKSNQQKLLADNYMEVNKFLSELADKKNAVIGEKIILPSSFPGSTRYYTENFEDAMALVRRFGSPDFFITMTCNPEWQEIKEAARTTFEDGSVLQQPAQDRPDLVARAAKLKFDELVDEFDKKQIFGKVSAYVYTVEFQKRGLPHMHLLLIMSSDDKIHNTEELDDFISAEIPDCEDPELRELVKKWMIHNPCGDLNPNASCMVNKNGRMKCRFGFPKPHLEETSLADNEKPNYRRRYAPTLDPYNPHFSHEQAIYRKDAEGRRITRDNRHVATYNAYLLKRFNCHINVEYVGSIRAVKYVYKYIYKGHDCAFIKVVENERKLNYNEADTYIQGRCITPPEACWRLSGNEIQKKSHSVQRLDIHLPGKFRRLDIDQAQEDLADTGQKESTLEAYFRYNRALRQQQENQDVDYHYYWQMPENFRWIGRTSEWVPRIRSLRVIGRIHNVNFVSQPELFHLRLLLYHVKNAGSFDDLLTVNGVEHLTYKQACLALGLTYDDQQWVEGLQESALSKMPRAMRTLFTQILIFGSPENPKALWDKFKENLAEDFIREARRNGSSIDEAIKRAYRIIAHKINNEATEGKDFSFWVKRYNMDDVEDCGNERQQEILNMNESRALGEQMYQLLKGEQIEIVDKIVASCNNPQTAKRYFFIDGPGGTGKTFIYKTLFYILSGRNLIVKCMAFTGIASILLPDGRTSHKTFGLKVPLTPESVSCIKPGSAKAKELARIDVFLMDEAPMLPKYGLNNMDLLLRSICNPNLPFGGKVMVLGGDFRQCLPIQQRANRSELVDLSIKKSNLWRHFNFFSLKENMRIDAEERDFAEYLLKIGNGDLSTNAMGEVEVPGDILSNGNLIDEVFNDCLANNRYEDMKDRAILAPLNKDVNKINEEIIMKLPGEYKVYKSYDSVKDQPEGPLLFTSEFLNSIEMSDLPPHELKLKKNTIIMLLRNLDVSEGLCNGTRLIVTELCNNIIKAKIITGENSGREAHIPRITLDSSKNQLGCIMQRHQFPVRAAFAMTIHKAQGQTFRYVGIHLITAAFMHGMLYVGFSRAKRRSGLKVLLPPENPRHTRNVVWREILGNFDTP